VGGGLIGMLTARQLKLEGHSVLLLDQGRLGAESSWAGGGILSPLYPWRYPTAVSRLAAYSAGHYRSLAQTLMQESGIDPEWTESGLLILDSDEKVQAQAWAQQFGHDLRIIDQATAIQSLEPGLTTQASEALWMPSVAQLRNPRLVKALKGSLQYHQIDYREQEAVSEIEQAKGRVVAVKTASRRIPTDTVIITAGAWSGALLQQLAAQLKVEPVRGQMLVYKAIPGLLRHMILDRGHYLIPRRDGRVLIGSTLEYVGFDKSTTAQARQQLSDCAVSLIPALARYAIEKHWSGLRPGSPSGVPYIGDHPEVQGLFFNCGHFRNGVILGLASVQLLLDLLAGRPPIIEPTPYALSSQH
jgi:glycine oxidase